MRYLSYSEYLKNKYGEKVYKIPVNLDITCPNRDGNCGEGGCIFCGAEGAAFENLPTSLPVKEQIERNIDFIGKKYNAEKYIVYFQNFTNTYMHFDTFKAMIEDSVHDNVCAVYVSTRPDCVCDEYMAFLKEFSERTGYDICIELGLQTVNYKTLKTINRGHTLAEFIDAVLTVKKYGFDICTHLILNLPWDDMEDVIECAKILSALRVDQVKLHCLYILKDTPLAKMYEDEEFSMGSHYTYIEKAVNFIRYLSPDIVIQRLIGRASEERSIFCNYGMSWWKIKDNIEEQLDFLDAYQGDKCDYLGGSAIRRKYN